MKRVEFLKKTLQMGLAAGGMFMFNGSKTLAQSGKGKSGQKPKDPHQKFKENWIKSLMENLKQQFDEKTRIKLMESCGRDCARRGAIRLAESCKGNVKKMVEILAKDLGKENNYIEGNVVHLEWNKCLCELVAEGPDRLPETYCYCSQGWILEMFETAADKSVEVELLQSVKRGAASCKFIVRL